MCDKPRGPPGWWDPTPLTLCSAVPTKGRQQGILQLLASRLLQIMSPYEKIQHKGQKVVCAAEQVARQMQRHRSPKSHFTTNLRAEAGRSTGKCTVWFYLEWKLLLCPVGSSLLPQHARSGQFSFKGHGRSIFTPSTSAWVCSSYGELHLLSFHCCSCTGTEASLWSSDIKGFFMPLEKYVLQVAEGNKINVSRVYFKSLQELHPHGCYISCKCCNMFSMGTSIHAQGTRSEPLRLCSRKHQSLLQMLSRVRSGGLTSLKNSQLARMSWQRSCSCDSFGSLVAVKVVSSWALEFCSCF